MRIYLDLESIPGQLPGLRDEFIASVQAPAIYKKPESIAEWLAENREREGDAAWQKTALDGTFGQVICIAWAVDDDDVQSRCVEEFSAGAEAELLLEVFAEMATLYSTHGTKPVLIGHNVAGFDIPFLWKRAIVRGVRPPFWFPRNPKPWSDAIADTMTMWAGDRDRISMDKLCRVLGIAGKGDGPTGADVWPMAQAGRFDEIEDYCRADVERTRAIHRRLMFEAA